MRWFKVIAVSVLLLLESGWALAQEPETLTTRMEEVVVTGTRTPHSLKDTPVETVLINREDIERSNAQTVTDILKNVPGLSASGVDDVFGDTSSRVRLRGMSLNDGYGLILIDGQRIHGSGQSGGHGEYAVGLNQIPVSMIERIEVVKGPSSVLYGSDAMVGVINVITRKTPSKAIAGAGASYGWYDVKERVRNGVTTKPSDDGRYRNLSEAYVYAGDRPHERLGYLINYANETGENTGSTPIDSERHSVMGKVNFQLTEGMDLLLKGELSSYEKEGSSPKSEDSHRISAGWTWKVSENHILQVKGYSYVDDFEAESSSSDRHGDIGYDQVEAQYTWYLGNSNVITTGTEFQRQGIDYIMDNSNGTRTTVDEDVDTWSVYVQDELTFFDRLVAVPGIRYDHHSTFDSSFNPKLSLMYHLTDTTALRGSVGKSFKSPTIRQLYYDVPFYHSPFWIKSNPDLDPEKSIGYSFGVEQYLFQDRMILNASYFRNDVDDMVVSESSDETYEGEELRIYKNVEEAMTQGVEVMARLMFDNDFSVSGSYTFTDSENKENGKELTYTPKHELTLSPTYEYTPWNVGVSGTFTYLSKLYTDTDNSYEVDAHCVVDANIYKKIGEKAKLTLEADNIFDSDKGDERNYRTGQTFIVKMDISY